MIYKCEICRQVYILKERPSNCPFCGSFEEHVKPVEDVSDIEEYELSQVSINNLSLALKKEDNAYQLYNSSKRINKQSELSNIFSIFKIHENWHNLIISDILKNNINMELFKSIKCTKHSSNNEENRRTAMIAEAQAMVDYKKYLEEATEPRVKMVFAALLEVEQMHLSLLS